MNQIIIAVAAALVVGGCSSTKTPPPTPVTLRVNVFPGASNLPILVGLDRGVFAKYGLTIELQNTPNSIQQRTGLAKGAFEIAHAAVDNAVAMVETAKEDVIIVLGGDGSMNEFYVRPEIRSMADVRGKTLVVDAPNTAYALVAKKILKNNGLLEGRDYKLAPVGGTPSRIGAMADNPENVAGMLNPPWSFVAQGRGLKALGRSIDLLGPYQAGGAFVMRKWAAANRDALERYITAYIESNRIAMDPANRTAVIGTLATRLKIDPAIAARTYEQLMIPRFGLAPDGRFDLEGFRNVLALRAEIEGQWGGKAPAADRYLDLGYYDRALARIK